MIYSLCEFEYGYEGRFYQESDNNGLVRFIDLNGNTLELIPPYGYYVIEDNLPEPNWVNND
jgi:hypothetical protein